MGVTMASYGAVERCVQYDVDEPSLLLHAEPSAGPPAACQGRQPRSGGAARTSLDRAAWRRRESVNPH
jgi:hypothetical protein